MQKLTQQDGTVLLVSDEQLQEIINSQPKKIESSIGWTPEIGEVYWFFNHKGVFNKTNYEDEQDMLRISFGICRKTEAEAQKAFNKQEALRRIHVYMRENGLVFYDVDWEDEKQDKWQITGWRYKEELPTKDVLFTWNVSKGDLYFRSKNDRQQILDNCKEDLEIFLK
jgi:hypothetical protein